MRLFRACCKEEVDAIKRGDPIKNTFGSPIFQYVGPLHGYRNHYHAYWGFWATVDGTSFKRKAKAICKTFANIPKCIPLFEDDVEKRMKMFKLYAPNFMEKDGTLSDMIPDELEEAFQGKGNDCTFMMTIKVAGFFEDPNVFSKIETEQDRRIVAINFPDEVAEKFKGMGYYPFGAVVEYALPMYMLKPENVVIDYWQGGFIDRKFKQDYLDGKEKS